MEIRGRQAERCLFSAVFVEPNVTGEPLISSHLLSHSSYNTPFYPTLCEFKSPSCLSYWQTTCIRVKVRSEGIFVSFFCFRSIIFIYFNFFLILFVLSFYYVLFLVSGVKI